MIYLLDTNVLIDVLNNRGGRPQLLDQFSRQDILLACSAINVTELLMGMRPGEGARTQKLVRSLEFYPVTRAIAELAADLYREWRKKGQTLGLADVTIAATALTHELVLVTENHKHFPMPELQLRALPTSS